MLRIGSIVACKTTLRPSCSTLNALSNTLSSSSYPSSCTHDITIRTMAGAKIAKTKPTKGTLPDNSRFSQHMEYEKKEKKIHNKSGLRFRRLNWWDTPRKRIIHKPRPKKHLLLATLNTKKRITIHTNKIKAKVDRGANPSQLWIRRIAHQVKVSPENAVVLIDSALNMKTADKMHPFTYATLLDLCYRRKDLANARRVFDHMRRNMVLDDRAFSIFAKCLATRGELEEALLLLEEREHMKIGPGVETLRVMVNYAAAAKLSDGVSILERFRARSTIPIALYSTIIGWALKHGDPELAAKYYQEAEMAHVARKYREIKTDEEYDKKLQAYNQAQDQRTKLMGAWADTVYKYESQKQFSEDLRNGKLVKPKLPKIPLYPKRRTVEEFLEKIPVPLTSHILRPLIDMEEAGKEIPWILKLGRSLSRKKVQKQIRGLAHKIFLGENKKRYEHLRNVLQKMGLDHDDLTYIPAPKVKGFAPRKRVKRTPKVLKWHKIGGKLKEETKDY